MAGLYRKKKMETDLGTLRRDDGIVKHYGKHHRVREEQNDQRISGKSDSKKETWSAGFRNSWRKRINSTKQS